MKEGGRRKRGVQYREKEGESGMKPEGNGCNECLENGYTDKNNDV